MNNNDIEIIDDIPKKKKDKNIKKIIFAIFLAIILIGGIVIGYTSAYFTSTVINNPDPSNTAVTTGIMEIEFTDGPTITLADLMP